jgi:hypothetical protein
MNDLHTIKIKVNSQSSWPIHFKNTMLLCFLTQLRLHCGMFQIFSLPPFISFPYLRCFFSFMVWTVYTQTSISPLSARWLPLYSNGLYLTLRCLKPNATTFLFQLMATSSFQLLNRQLSLKSHRKFFLRILKYPEWILRKSWFTL